MHELKTLNITNRQNKIEPVIDCTNELEANNILPFLDILLINNDKLRI